VEFRTLITFTALWTALPSGCAGESASVEPAVAPSEAAAAGHEAPVADLGGDVGGQSVPPDAPDDSQEKEAQLRWWVDVRASDGSVTRFDVTDEVPESLGGHRCRATGARSAVRATFRDGGMRQVTQDDRVLTCDHDGTSRELHATCTYPIESDGSIGQVRSTPQWSMFPDVTLVFGCEKADPSATRKGEYGPRQGPLRAPPRKFT